MDAEQQATKHAYVVIPSIQDYRGVVITGGEQVRALITSGAVDNQHIEDEKHFDDQGDAVQWCAEWLRKTVK